MRRTDNTGARMRPVLTLDARDFGQGDVSATCDEICAELESRFGVRTEIEAPQYPYWRILASGARFDEAARHAATFKDCGQIVARGAGDLCDNGDQAMGHGVSWFDDHKHFEIKIPHMEVSSFSFAPSAYDCTAPDGDGEEG